MCVPAGSTLSGTSGITTCSAGSICCGVTAQTKDSDMTCYGVEDPLCPFGRQSTTTYIHMPYMYTGIRGTGVDSATTASSPPPPQLAGASSPPPPQLAGGGSAQTRRDGSGSAPIGIIIGGSIGAVALIGLAGVAFYCTQKKKPETANVQLTVIGGSSIPVEPLATPLTVVDKV